jgi:hypothetical protein
LSVSNPSLVVLNNGLSVPIDALRLLWELEHRGLDVRVDAEGLSVGPRQQLTDIDRHAIREHKQSLMAMVLLCNQVVQ